MSLAGLQDKEHTNKKHQWRPFRMGNVAVTVFSSFTPPRWGLRVCCLLPGGCVAGDCPCEMQEVEGTGSSWSFISGFALFFIFVFHSFQPEHELAVLTVSP